MKILVLLLGVLAAVQVGSVNNKSVHLCEGFAEQNDRSYPVGMMSPFMNTPSGISEAEFTDGLNRVEALLAPEVAAKGAKLVVNRMWDSSEVNAYAHREENNEWHIDMHGGLARHPLMSADGYVLVACHEMGHHIGGTPHYSFDVLSNEGQSDYYASLKCFRRLYTKEENAAWAANTQIDPIAKTQCEAHYSSKASRLACMRAVHAGIVLGNVLSDLSSEANGPTLATPDTSVVKATRHYHPKAQCRLDTYFAGATCDRRVDSKLSDKDYRAGTCEKADGYDYGFRPRCWFAPDIKDDTTTVLLDKVAAL